MVVWFHLMAFHVDIALKEVSRSMARHVKNVHQEHIHLKKVGQAVGFALGEKYQTMVQSVDYALKEHIVWMGYYARSALKGHIQIRKAVDIVLIVGFLDISPLTESLAEYVLKEHIRH